MLLVMGMPIFIGMFIMGICIFIGMDIMLGIMGVVMAGLVIRSDIMLFIWLMGNLLNRGVRRGAWESLKL